MKISDRIYGEEEIKEQVIIDLINSDAVQRLKGISQLGPPQEYYHVNTFSRYEHSLGVLILLRRLNSPLENQVAGLLHDVSHTAFSHIVDWIFDNGEKEDYQDKIHSKMIKNSNLPEILENYGFDFLKIAKLEAFPLLDKPIPSLCVDRFDYSIREISDWVNPPSVPIFVDNLINYQDNLSFSNSIIAENFAKSFLRCQIEHWGGIEARARYYLFAKLFKNALSKKIISMNDFLKTDQYIINLLEESRDNEIIRDLNFLKNKRVALESNTTEGIILKKKFRHVDPEVLANGAIKRLSFISPEYKSFLEDERKKAELEKKIIFLEKLS